MCKGKCCFSRRLDAGLSDGLAAGVSAEARAFYHCASATLRESEAFESIGPKYFKGLKGLQTDTFLKEHSIAFRFGKPETGSL
jgi:hypothetical protein